MQLGIRVLAVTLRGGCRGAIAAFVGRGGKRSFRPELPEQRRRWTRRPLTWPAAGPRRPPNAAALAALVAQLGRAHAPGIPACDRREGWSGSRSVGVGCKGGGKRGVSHEAWLLGRGGGQTRQPWLAWRLGSAVTVNRPFPHLSGVMDALIFGRLLREGGGNRRLSRGAGRGAAAAVWRGRTGRPSGSARLGPSRDRFPVEQAQREGGYLVRCLGCKGGGNSCPPVSCGAWLPGRGPTPSHWLGWGLSLNLDQAC